MSAAQILLLAGAIFLCLWSALLARFKGYSAACWLLAGGLVGVLVLSRLAMVGAYDSRKRRNGNLLGLALSVLSILGACLLAVLT